MKLVNLINWMLGFLGIAVIRKSTLNRVKGIEQGLEVVDTSSPKLKEIKKLIDLNRTQLIRHQISVKWDMIDVLARSNPPKSTLKCPLCNFQGKAFCIAGRPLLIPLTNCAQYGIRCFSAELCHATGISASIVNTVDVEFWASNQ